MNEKRDAENVVILGLFWLVIGIALFSAGCCPYKPCVQHIPRIEIDTTAEVCYHHQLVYLYEIQRHYTHQGVKTDKREIETVRLGWLLDHPECRQNWDFDKTWGENFANGYKQIVTKEKGDDRSIYDKLRENSFIK